MCEMKQTFLYVFSLGIFLELEGVIGMQKSLRLPLKRGRECMCKWIQNFGNLSHQWEIISLPLPYCCI
jgi:hypothetical protein